MGIMNVVSLLGGLALFLFGMDVMGKALEKQAGSKLQVILKKLTASPVKGLFLGLAVTAIIQSSSATTVMVVGFVNSGIMTLRQAIGVIMGANVGTTVTSWLLSLTSIQGDSLLIQIFKPTFFAPILAMIGVILRMAKKKENVGTILLGFATLIFGMEAMSTAVKPLSTDPGFTSLMTAFSNPLLGILMGAFMTAVIQSSSASVGILQALSSTGVINYSMAVPIIMGQNIGTCVTALISSVGANKNAKRAAMVHLYFNIIGVILFMVLFYALNAIFRFSFMQGEVNAFGIAVVHTIFNLVTTAALLPFTKLLEKMAIKTVPDHKHTDKKVTLLDERLFATPSLAVARSQDLTARMGHLAESCFLKALELIHHDRTPEDEELIRKEENELDIYEDDIGTYLVRLSQMELNQEDSRQISKLLRTISDFERIGDHGVNLLFPLETKPVFSQMALQQLDTVQAAITELLSLTVKTFTTNDFALAHKIEPLEQVIDQMTNYLRDQHIERLKQGVCTVEAGIILLDILTNVERVADHCSNIASAMIETQKDALDLHGYLRSYRLEDPDFRSNFRMYQQKYAMPKTLPAAGSVSSMGETAD